ncbi:hypothetical protein BP6252_09403 [Coleophoma cylindrospora]|uniref:NAD-dependent epimerase/dehydratase domain-containing protein n=1 Tax=Coleophoma cylindrospora TaxID=1849047 RepID=A0A3D8R1U7_9HELO|nr:hypothetical protein BP6252_09403 [Coleophoma cylindrospora]
MTRVLLTGGSGFLAAHVLETLLKKGHSVVTTVRSQGKADKIKEAFPGYDGRLDFTIVEDIAQPNAFDNAVISDPPFEAIIHTASPFHFNVTDIQKVESSPPEIKKQLTNSKDLLDPAMNGTLSILRATQKSAPTVKTVVLTSSFAAVSNFAKGAWPEHTYTEDEWNPMTVEDALSNPARGYTGSKALAEKAAWDFMQKEKPSFTLTTILPTLVFGPIFPGLHSLESMNTSNALMYGITKGMAKQKIPDLGGYCFVDVREVALGHVRAMELPTAANQRFLFSAGQYNNRLIVNIIRENFPEYHAVLPDSTVEGGDFPAGGTFQIGNAKSKEILGIQYRSLEDTVVDTVKSFQKAA